VKTRLDTKHLPLRFYLIIAFIEGAAVMVCELLSARMIAPYYGTTLFVWSTVIGVTLAALAIGYFLGGYYADRYAKDSLLFSVLGIGSGLIALMPLSARFILEATSSMGVRSGSLVSAVVFLLPPLVCLGMTSPIIIRLASRDVQHTGRTAGNVYAVSTISGILITFLLGFYIIPMWGITRPAYYSALLLGVFPLTYFFRQKQYSPAFAMVAVFVAVAFMLFSAKDQTLSNLQVLYKSEGLLGQVVVADYQPTDKPDLPARRVLLVNRHSQTAINKQTGHSIWPYVHATAVVASIKPPGSKAVVLGLGAGSVTDEFLRLGFDVDACELDERIVNVGKEFFRLDPRCSVEVDDARHYIRTRTGKYDIVMFDLFNGEQPPSHLLTIENLAEVRNILKPDGIVLINFTGFLTGEPGKSARSVLRTLRHAGFHTKLIATPGKEEDRNLIFAASLVPMDYSQLSPERQNACCREEMKVPIPPPFIDEKMIDLQDALIFTDDRPSMELAHLEAGEIWRKGTTESLKKILHNANLFGD
jgi:predicted membrane-bound spermidine synthase